MRRTAAAATVLSLALATLAAAQAPQRKEPNLGGDVDLASQDPAVALARLKPADGYEVSLFASEREFPELANPLAMTFDTRGRLWVLTSPTYPHVGPDETPNDKLIIVEDGNGDGRADKVKVFADRLYIPTGFALGDGGVYVSQQPNLMFLQDTNGDDRADVRRVILHGFGTEDSHHSIHAYTWGPDGALYFQEGTFLHSQVETPYGPVRVDNAAVFRYEPRTEKLSVFVTYPFANPWGHVIDGWGQNFISDASNGYNYWGTAFSGHVDYPNKQKPMREWTLTRVRPTAGSEFVRSRHFPESAQGNFLFNNTIGFQGIKQYRTVDDGSGFVGIEVEPLLQSTDANFRPVAMQFGPDGALYVVDWFNPLVGHMQYSLRDPRRDKTHGRVWRITARGRPLLARPVIHGAALAQQLDLLKAYEDRTRYQARLALRDRPTAEVLPAVQRWIDGLDPKDPDVEHHLLEALWVHEHHDTVNLALLKRLLGAKEFRARAAAVRVLQHWFDRVDGALALLAPMVRDEAPRVRLEAVRALSFVPTAAAAEAALGVLAKPMDYYLQYVLDSTMTTLEPVWKPRLTSGAPFAEDNPAGLAFVLERLEPGELASVKRSDPVYEALLTRSGIDPALRRDALGVLATRAGVPMATALLAAVSRVAATPGAGAATADLMRLLADLPAADLAAQRPALESLARTGALDTVREGALLALLRLDGSADAVWRLTGTSARLRMDLLRAAAAAPEGPAVDSLRAAVLPWLRDAVATGAALAPPQPPLTGRYVRLVRPGRATVLSVTEVQVFSGGENVAVKGSATQSSTLAGGATGGHAPRAIDGGLEPNLPAGTDPLKGTVQFTSTEQDPWWELDLGVERPIDTIALWAASADTRNGLYVSILDANRRPVFVQDGLRLQAPMHPIDVGGDLTIPLQAAAITLLPGMRGHEAETVPLLATLVIKPALRQAALAAIRRMPPAAWPPAQVPAVAREVLRDLSAIPAAQRIGPAVAETFAFGRELVARLPEGPDRQAMTAQLDALLVRVIRIEAVAAQMKYDVSRFTVTAGETVVIELVNKDEMPHNLVVGKEGALETIGLAADKMVALPDAFAKSFVPATPEVLFSIRLLNPGETVQARFTAPTQPGNYPFICTFPAHWRTMNGIVEVRPAAAQVSQP
jgi:glucose/arabinose dehydrogenase/azurin